MRRYVLLSGILLFVLWASSAGDPHCHSDQSLSKHVHEFLDYRDAAIIYGIIDGMYGKPWYQFFVGGLGRYRKTPVHGPFVHIDVRGFRARWGT